MIARTNPFSASGDASSKSFVLFNARSIVRKWAIICDKLVLYKPAIGAVTTVYTACAVTETWLNKDITPYYNYKDYQIFHKCCKGGGGECVALFFDIICTVDEIVPSVSPPASCQVLSVVDVKTGHCWTLV